MTAKLTTLDKKDGDGQKIGVDDHAICIYTLEGGAVGTMTASWTFYGQEDNSTILYGTKGIMRIYDSPNASIQIFKKGEVISFDLDRIQTNESYILFLRRVSAPDTPYYTLEVEPDGTVRQKRTKFDRQEPDIEDAKKFLAEWQRTIARRLTENDREKAAASRVLREREFDQMRRDNVIIYTGDLAGRRLVDVLTADLMENAA